jgi:rhodanese-related sulfurtransferase
MNKIIKTYLVFQAVSMLFIYSCEKNEDTTSETSYTDVMASRLQSELIDDASISPYEAIFDVSPVFKQGHLPFATNAGSVEGLGDMLDQWDKSTTYLVYCHADSPAMAGAQLMEDAGFENVYRLEGNFDARVNAGYAA